MPSGDIFKMGQSYEADLLAQARGHARTMQWVAVAAIAMFALCALGLVFMASTHTVTSHVVMVDKATGASEVLAVSGVRDVPAQGIQAMAEVQRYVALRERYNFGILQADYNEVVAKTSEPILQAYSDEITLKADKNKGALEEKVEILNVTLPPDQVGRAVVRFGRRVMQSGKPEVIQNSAVVVTLAYHMVPSPIGKKENLLLNPLGFKVSSYVAEPELGAR